MTIITNKLTVRDDVLIWTQTAEHGFDHGPLRGMDLTLPRIHSAVVTALVSLVRYVSYGQAAHERI